MSSLIQPRIESINVKWFLSTTAIQVLMGSIIFALLITIWFLTAHWVTVRVDGLETTLRTHRHHVSTLLMDVDLNLHDNDQVSVAGNAPIRSGMVITVTRSPLYRLFVDNRDLTVSSMGRTPAQVIRDAGIAINSFDRVAINGNVTSPDEEHILPTVTKKAQTYAFRYPWEAIQQEPLQMRVYRAIPISVSDGGLTFEIRTTSQTVGEALREAKITIFRGDRVEPKLGNPINTGLKIYIERSIPVSVAVDGRYIKTRTLAQRVGDALTDIGIGLTGLDQVTPPLGTKLYDNIEIRINRRQEDIEVEEDIVPYETVFVPDTNLLIDTQQMVNPGAEGITRERTRVLYEDGQEISQVVEDIWVAQEPAQRVIAYGQRIVPNTIEIEGQQISYWRRIRMLATSYSANTAGVSPDAPWYGKTYSGDTMRKGIVAIDPSVIPLRTRVYVPGYGYGDALDTGSAIRARRIDLGFDDNNLELWNKWVDVYLLWPPPPTYQITWVLPNWPRVPN